MAVETIDTGVFKKVESRILGVIPESWIKTTLGECFKWGSGGTPKSGNFKYYGGNIPWLVIGDLNDGIINESSQKITEKGLQNSSAKLVDEGTLLLAMYGSIGKLGIAGMKLATNQAIAFAEKNEIETKYLFNFLRYARLQLADLGKGATQQNISQTVIKAFPFPLAPLNEQKRIVAKIEELFSELDNGIAALKTAREQLKVYRQAVLKHAFEGKLTAKWREENADKLESPEQLLARIQQEREARYQQQLKDWETAVKEWETNGKDGKKLGKPKKYTTIPLMNDLAKALPAIPNSWKWVSFSELLFSIRGGSTTPPIDTPTDLPILRSSSIRAGRLNLEDIRYLPEDSKISDDDYLSFSDLLFSRLNGTLEFVGVCASVPLAIPKNLLYPDRLYCAKLVDSEMVKSCEYYFLSPYIRRNIEKKAKSTAGHKRISIPDISEQPIPIFDSGEMKELENLLSEKFSLADKLQEEIENSLSDAETLRQSILKKAFSGQLVPQDPNDEPASELLARIQAEKEAANTQKAKKTTKIHSTLGH